MTEYPESGLEHVGQTMTYPRDRYLLDFLTELRFEAAIAEVERLAPEANLGCGLNAAGVRASGEYWRFLNKLAVCVQVTMEGDRIAIYHRDGIFWRVRAVPHRKA